MRYFHNAIKFSESDVAQFRLEVINFYIKHGLTATKEAYKVGRSSIFAWKKLYADSLGNLTSLLPESTKPKIPRRMLVDPKTLEFIKTLREDNGRLGKEKIKILTDVYCTKENLKKISASKIGRIIKRNNWFYHKIGKIYHDPSSGRATIRAKRHKERLVGKPGINFPGELIQMDSVVRYDLNLKRYIITAIDLYSKFTFAFSYKSLSSSLALDFYQKLEIIAPFTIKSVKTDNVKSPVFWTVVC
jgi:hypothetical protein